MSTPPTAAALPPLQHSSALRALFDSLRRDNFLLILLAGFALLSVVAPNRLASYPALVDWPTIAALTGLLALTKGLELSGAMAWLGHRLVAAMATERAAALWSVAAAALLSTVLTNDVALFIVVPLTLGVCRVCGLSGMPATRLIVFEALAVNAGSALTPIGNPQNLFIWQLSKAPFGQFVLHMLPLVVSTMLVLVALTACVFGKRPVAIRDDAIDGAHRTPIDRRLLAVSLGLYLPFLAATDLHHGGLAVLAVLATFVLLRPRVLAQLDWGLLLVFVLMFVDLRLLAGLEAVRHAMLGLGLDQAGHLYFAGIAASQVISNVPAAIALAEYSRDWRVLAYGVNVGGFGFLVGSLANLIALRMSGDRRAWLSFHAYSLPFLAVAAALGYVLLFYLKA
ncbi:MAG: anion transporter [Massilia sp.]|nr:anion transporter [Massilia sp.]